MTFLGRLAGSTFQSWKLNIQQTVDYTYRQLIGVPTLRRSQITPQLFLGGQYSQRGIKILQKRGITGIVSMRTHPKSHLPDLNAPHFLHLPTPDLAAPTLSQLRKGIEFITQEIRNGGKVYVHCHAGVGRGPSMVAAYLMSTGLTLDDAFARIKAVRTFIAPTSVQIARLRQYEAELLTPKS